MRRNWFPRAFSLIEVTLSLAVVSFALLAVLTLLPLGLKMIIDSSQAQAKANILTQVRSQLAQLPFSASTNVSDTSSIQTLSSATNYYDSTGAPTTIATNYYYSATFAVGSLNVNNDTEGFVNNTITNAASVTVYLTYPLNLPSSAQKVVTNSIFVAKQVGN
jgi:uncharacterized protein (TIGR02598 family)